MRWGLAFAAFLAASLATAAAGSSQAPRVSVSVGASQPSPSAGRTALGQREFAVVFHVSVSASETCENLSVAYTYGTRFNGRPSLGENATESFDTNAPATSGAFDVRTTASTAETVAFSARGTCEQEDGTVLSASSRVPRTVRIPAHSCEQGPLRVLALRGGVKRTGRVPLRAGNYVRPDDSLSLGRRSRVAFGAPQCRGFRVSISGARGGAVRTGSYASASTGLATIVSGGLTVDLAGDRHAGGIQTPSALVLPRGISRARIVAAASGTTVRVRSGAVRAAARIRGSTYSKGIVVRAGQTVRCAAGACR